MHCNTFKSTQPFVDVQKQSIFETQLGDNWRSHRWCHWREPRNVLSSGSHLS